MKNTKLIVIVILIIALLGLGVTYFLKSSPKSSSDADSMMTDDTPSAKTGAQRNNIISGNIYDLLARGENITCTFSSESDGSRVEGTVYVTGKNSRSDITSTDAEGNVLDNHAIIKDDVMYMWSSDREEGMKLAVPEDPEDLPESLPQDTSSDTKMNADTVMEKLNYDCNAWRVDQSMLEVPTNITFVDLSAQFDELKNQLQDACSMCNQQESPEAIAQCKQILNCE